MDALKLLALDEEDLAILSAHLQDALVKVADIGFLPKTQRFVLVLDRFDWDKACADTYVRHRAGLHFERVRNVRSRGFDRQDAEGILNLLAVTFAPGEAPSGTVTLAFSGGADICFEVECIEARLSDLGPSWGCKRAPEHAPEAVSATGASGSA
ncbi:DUF2948 family protein [Aquabacter spiritensis]|uniref:DUF2948 family protein n=1 Tax=Aquabacter spiritensis TaxID=933073 RepID=A0A4R3LVT1_9HYPH|nr:DUF2948 family protein [Aquabacter spiritensis]TCT04760.1 DUF2948 family protein [Aquabacter spiritensis]